MLSYTDFFRIATGLAAPHGFQQRIAEGGLPDVVEAPTGVGKTAGLVLGWLWRQQHADPAGTPRRLVFALPQRSLVDQVADDCGRWLTNLGLTDTVALHVVMGGHGQTQWAWRLGMDRPAIVVGTVDSLVSKALNRGYGVGRSIYPVDFALVTNDAHWVVDEVQLCPESTATLRQVAAFARRWSTVRPFGLTCMSATIRAEILDTVDNRWPGAAAVCRIEPAERAGELATRLGAARTVHRLPVDGSVPAAFASQIRRLHRPGTLTLVVVNTVAAAREVFRALGGEDVRLLHSRFRGRERSLLAARLRDMEKAGGIAVATQVVEAGVDIDASLLVTEAAPWPSVVQRAGRCNRRGQTPHAQLWWCPPVKEHPYEKADIAASVAQLEALEGRAVTSEDLLACQVPVTPQRVAVLREPDFVGLFDTMPDLSNGDVDISPYVRDAEESDVQLVWAQWTEDRPVGRLPGHEWRCRAPIGETRRLLGRVSGWRWDQQSSRWAEVDAATRLRPGETILLHAAYGGYDPVLGLDPSSKKVVADCPPLASTVDRTTGGEDGFGEDETGRVWLTVDQHSADARTQASALLEAAAPALPDGVAQVVVRAAWLHDVGKCHPMWQEAILGQATPERRKVLAGGGPWAKSDTDGMLRFPDGVRFRHELVSMLLLDGPLSDLVADLADPELARYLVLAHHGKLRIQVREPADPEVGWDGKALLGLRDGEALTVPAVLGRPPTELSVDLGQFRLGGQRSWTRTALRLRDRYGPFLLAYLETLVRVADWRASAQPGSVGPADEGATA